MSMNTSLKCFWITVAISALLVTFFMYFFCLHPLLIILLAVVISIPVGQYIYKLKH